MNYEQNLSKRAQELKPSGIRKFFDMLTGMEDVISLTVGQPDFVTPWHIRDAAIESLQQGRTYYTSNSGLAELREEIAKYLLRRFDLQYDAGEIIVTVGGSEAIDIAVRAIVDPGDEVIIPMPSFVCYEPIVRLASGVPVILNTREEDDFRLRAENRVRQLIKRRADSRVDCSSFLLYTLQKPIRSTTSAMTPVSLSQTTHPPAARTYASTSGCALAGQTGRSAARRRSKSFS